jgi:AraC-like DNA-binding protein
VTKDSQSDPVYDALVAVAEALRRSTDANGAAITRVEQIIREREQGASYRDIVLNEERPLIVELLSANYDRLRTAGGQLRRTEAKALYDEGLTMEQIAELFGVSRQRVARILKPMRDGASSPLAASLALMCVVEAALPLM